MAISTCIVTGNVRNLLGSNVSGVIIQVNAPVPFTHSSSVVVGQLASATTDSNGDFSLTVIETETVGQALVCTFKYSDGTSANKSKSYYLVVPDTSTVDISTLIVLDTNPVPVAEFPASNVTVVPEGNLASTDAQSAFEELQADIDLINATAQTQTLASGKIWIGNASNLAAPQTLTGDVTVDNGGITAISSGVIVNADVNASAAIAYSKLNLANSILNADVNTSAAIAYSKLALTGSIVNADINASAAIVDTKLATISTANKVSNSATTATSANTASAIVARDSSGNFSAGTISAALTGTASGNTTYTANNHGVVVSSATNAMTVIAPSSSTVFPLVSGGSSANPTWAGLSVGGGGTGQTSLTLNNVLLGNTTSGVQFVAPGTSGNVLTSNGTTWSSSAPAVATVNQSQDISNLGISATVAANALTIALKQADGTTDPSSGTSAVNVSFRNATITTGGYTSVSATGAVSVVIPSGTTIGTKSGKKHYIYVYAINNAGTLELAVSLQQFDPGSVVTTAAISGGATNTTLYSTTARTNVPARLIGRINVSEATAGTWATSPTEVSVNPKLDTFIPIRYTPTFGGGFGTVDETSAKTFYTYVNGWLFINGGFKAGTVSGSEASITLPSSYVVSSFLTTAVPVGNGTKLTSNGSYLYYDGSSATKLFWSSTVQNTSGVNQLNGNEVCNNGEFTYYTLQVPVELA